MEDRPMAQRSKREYLQSIYERDRGSSRAEKQKILDEFRHVCGYHRKYAIWLLNRPLSRLRPRRVPARRSLMCWPSCGWRRATCVPCA